MNRAIGWIFVAICTVSAFLALIFSFTETEALPGSVRVNTFQFFIPVAIGWLAMVPRSRRDWHDLWTGHPLAQRFFGGKPAGFFGDYRRKLTGFGKALLVGTIALFALVIVLGAVRVDLFIIGAFYIVALSSWIIRLELDGDRGARIVRGIASALIYKDAAHTGA